MPETVGVGLVGMGTVGSAVVRRLMDEWELLSDRAGATPVLRRVAVRDIHRSRTVNLKSVPVVDDPLAVIDDPAVGIVVEAMGGLQPATSLIETALSAGKRVVTANKAVIAMSGPRLLALAQEHGGGLWFEAAVGAGLPVVAMLRRSLLADRVQSVDAVINGTTNVILTRMREDGVSLQTALADAQRRGFAEADPSSDVDGWDATYKLVIMTWLAFGAHVDVNDVDRRGIAALDRVDLAYTGQLGYAVKLLAHAERGRGGTELHLRVRPTAVPDTHPLFSVNDSDNAVIISSDLASRVMLSGLGAGGESTASAVVSDIVDAVRSPEGGRLPVPAAALTSMSDEDVEVAGYVRVVVEEAMDARELVVQAMEDRGVRVLESMDKPPLEGRFPQLVLLTGEAPRAVHDRALETLDTLSVVRRIACAMDRVEPAA